MRKQAVISKIVIVLVNEELSAKDAIDCLDKAKDVYLERSFHVRDTPKDEATNLTAIDIKKVASTLSEMIREDLRTC